MENPDQDLPQSVMRTQSTGSDAAVGSEPEPNTQETREPRRRPPPLALIDFRIQQLHNRRFLLLNMQRFHKKAEDNSSRTTEEITCEGSDELCELEAIERELEELLVKKETLEKQGNSTGLTGNEGQQDSSTFYITETPRGGIYMLPPPQLTQEDITTEQKITTRPAAERPTGPVTPADRLGQTPTVTKCPSCDQVVFTETHSKVGEAMWTICCLCSTMGCIAGCCLLPFFIDNLKSVQHHCPNCQAHIHTYQPF